VIRLRLLISFIIVIALYIYPVYVLKTEGLIWIGLLLGITILHEHDKKLLRRKKKKIPMTDGGPI